MGVKDVVLEVKQSFESELSDIKAQQSVVEMKIEKLDAALVSYDAELKAAEDKGFDLGVAQAGAAGKDDKIFSLEELNAEIEAQTAPLKLQIAGLEKKMEEMAMVVASKDGEMAAYKEKVRAAYLAQQAEESKSEAGFGELI